MDSRKNREQLKEALRARLINNTMIQPPLQDNVAIEPPMMQQYGLYASQNVPLPEPEVRIGASPSDPRFKPEVIIPTIPQTTALIAQRKRTNKSPRLPAVKVPD